jgi:hypothetical protein
MPTTFSLSLSPNYKMSAAKHRKWGGAVIGNGESWPRFVPTTVAAAADVVRLGLIPAYDIAAPTTATSGASSPATYSVGIVYRATAYFDGLSGDGIQSNVSNVVSVTLAATDAAVLTVVPSTDTKVAAVDIYAAQVIDGTPGTYYRVVKDAANTAGTVTFNIQASNGWLIGAGVTGGTADTTAKVLATDNDYPTAQPYLLEAAGRLISFGGISKRVTASVTNGSASVTTAETVYDGIEFWYFRKDDDAAGGVDGRGTYLARYSSATGLSLVAADGTAATYAGTTGSGTATLWQAPNRGYSKLYNPHAVPADNVSDDYPGPLLAGGKVPNSSRVLLMGRDFVVAEDYDRLPITTLNLVSDEYGCSSHFSVVAAHGRLFWLDFGKGKREVVMSDGTNVTPLATGKIKSVLNRLTLDANGDVWRVGFIHGAYYQPEDTIRWGLYLDGSTTANYVLELDLATGDVRGDPNFYAHRYLDAFTFGQIRGRVFVGQFGWPGGKARIGQDNVADRFRDWVEGGTLSGTLATTGQTTTVLTIASGSLYTGGDGLAGVPLLVWQESSGSSLVANPTYYHCRIASNDETTLTINAVETMNAVGEVTAVATELPAAPSGAGWQWRVGCIQAIVGPKWVVGQDGDTSIVVRKLAVTHGGQAVASASSPIKAVAFENFDTVPRSAQYLDPSRDGSQVSDTTLYANSHAAPNQGGGTKVTGFALHDNNVNTDTSALDIESIKVE